MKPYIILSFLLVTTFLSEISDAQQKAGKLPVIPIGLDAYRMWEKWPMQRFEERAYMRSTYDRKGGNESADASHFLFANGEDENITLDVKGSGIFYFFRANHWHGSPWHFIIDGKDNIVKETGTLDAGNEKIKINESKFIPEKPFPEPLNWTWTMTNGADLIWTPMPFKDSMRVAYSLTHYGTGYYIYDLYGEERNLSRTIKSWNINNGPDKKVLDLIGRSGSDIAPKNITKRSGMLRLDKESVLISEINTAIPSSIRAFKLTIGLDSAINLERLRLLITWDGSAYPSIDAPLCLFFGAGTFYNRNKREYLVKGFPINIRYDYEKRKIELACYYPMPFLRSAKFEIAGINPGKTVIGYEIRYEPLGSPFNWNSYFHATYKDFPSAEPGKDLIWLDTRGIEGQQQWSGNFVGTSFIFSHNACLSTLEGDPRFFFDDSGSPQGYGTGTEEWGGGGDYWGGQNMTLPFAGHPCGSPDKAGKNKKDSIESAYRFLLSDLMPFGQRAVIQFEHGGENLSTEHYEAVTYWYGLPVPALVKTDEIDIGKIASELAHQYFSPQSSAAMVITSRYELGIDTFPEDPEGQISRSIPGYKDSVGKEIFPAHQEDGRYTNGISEFIVRLDKHNIGVLLRRTLDYSIPNQTAKVYIQHIHEGRLSERGEWEYAGLWYLAGANTTLYSDPKGEKDKRTFKIETSDRRFRDDEFLIPSYLTKNCSSIRIRLKVVPNRQELFPGVPFPRENAWSELRYKVYSYVIPKFSLKN